MHLLTYFPDIAEPLNGTALRCGLPLKEAYEQCVGRIEALHRDVDLGLRAQDNVTRRLINKYRHHAEAIQVLMLKEPQLVGTAS